MMSEEIESLGGSWAVSCTIINSEKNAATRVEPNRFLLISNC